MQPRDRGGRGLAAMYRRRAVSTGNLSFLRRGIPGMAIVRTHARRRKLHGVVPTATASDRVKGCGLDEPSRTGRSDRSLFVTARPAVATRAHPLAGAGYPAGAQSWLPVTGITGSQDCAGRSARRSRPRGHARSTSPRRPRRTATQRPAPPSLSFTSSFATGR